MRACWWRLPLPPPTTTTTTPGCALLTHFIPAAILWYLRAFQYALRLFIRRVAAVAAAPDGENRVATRRLRNETHLINEAFLNQEMCRFDEESRPRGVNYSGIASLVRSFRYASVPAGPLDASAHIGAYFIIIFLCLRQSARGFISFMAYYRI